MRTVRRGITYPRGRAQYCERRRESEFWARAYYVCSCCCRYLQPPRTWVACAWESRELLTVCIKRLRGLNKVKLVDAAFVWTEPHSKRIKTKLTVQKEVSHRTTASSSRPVSVPKLSLSVI